MRTIFVHASAVIGTIALVACGSTDTSTTNRPLFDSGVNVLEAQVVDGNTGELITNAKVTVKVGRTMLSAENEAGFYTVFDIPYGTFRVLVSASGYEPFQAIKNFTNSSPNDRLSDGDPRVYYFNNIIVYPTGEIPDDIRVSVYDGVDGSPVAGATVVADLTTLSNLVDIQYVLAPSAGLLPNTVVATTDANGKATFAASQLVMGATYSVDVYGALDDNGVFLVPASNQTVRVGYSVQELVIFLSRPALTPVALMANNEDTENLINTLVVTFPYAIDLCSTPSQHTWSNTTNFHGVTDTDGDTVVTSPATTDPVTAALSNGDATLTLSFATENDDAGDDLWVTFSSVRVKPTGSSDNGCTALNAVSLRSGGTLSTEIHVREVP